MKALALSLLLICPFGCKNSPPAKPASSARARVSPTTQPTSTVAIQDLFDPAYPFACSPDPAVGCSGVFAPRRRAAASEQSEAAIPWSGEDAFRARVASLRQARYSIRIQALIFRADESGLLIADLLKAKKKAGLRVRVIVDALSNLDWRTQWMYFDLKRHGIEVEGYEALYLQWLTAEVKSSDPLRANKRFHEKMWIVDAEAPERRLAIVGGMNIANEYFRVALSHTNRWLDQDIILRGPAVKDITSAFDRNYEFFKRIKRDRPGLFNPDNAWKLTRRVLARIKRFEIPTWRRKALDSAAITILAQSYQPIFQPISCRFLQSRPRLQESYISQAYLNLIARAKRTILIANAYFIPSRMVIDALQAAARRGVRVVILTNSPQTNDIRSVALVSRHIYADLLHVREQTKRAEDAQQKPGIAIYEWGGARFGEGTLHAKFAVFDERAAIIGSHNLDPRSTRLNSESALALTDTALVQQLASHFLRELLPKSRRISREQAVRFHHPKRIAKTFELLFALPLKGTRSALHLGDEEGRLM
jgi:putative cardiolipin synthase